MSLARSIAARMLAPKKPEVQGAPKRRAPKYATQALEALSADEVTELVFGPPPPPTPAPPPRNIKPGWRGACQAVCVLTGRRCRLPEHRVDEPHRHERGAFTLTAAPGSTPSPARAELERAATARTSNPLTET